MQIRSGAAVRSNARRAPPRLYLNRSDKAYMLTSSTPCPHAAMTHQKATWYKQLTLERHAELEAEMCARVREYEAPSVAVKVDLDGPEDVAGGRGGGEGVCVAGGGAGFKGEGVDGAENLDDGRGRGWYRGRDGGKGGGS